MTARAMVAGVVLAGTLVAAGAAPAGVATEKVGRIAHDLAEGYAAKRPLGGGETLAVFTFRCPLALEKQQVGFAVAELLLREMAQTAKFRVVERSEMKRVLEEHAFSLTGAVDSDSAVKVGKLLGAKLGAMGSVDALGSQYQLNARLVDLESGEVLATGFQEVPREAFEVEAGNYLNLVPEEQAVGLYGAFAYGFSGATYTPELSYTGGSTSGGASFTNHAHLTGVSSLPGEVGVGVRYLALRHVMVDLGFWPIGYNVRFAGTVDRNGTWSDGGTVDAEFKGLGGEVAVFWTSRFGRRFRWFAGAGVSGFSMTKVDNNAGSGAAAVKAQFNIVGPQNNVTPMIHGGMEWRPAGRFGWLVSIFLCPSPHTYPIAWGEINGNHMEAGTFVMPTAGLVTTAALYF